MMDVARFARWLAFPVMLALVGVVVTMQMPWLGSGGIDADAFEPDVELDRTVEAFYDANADISMDRPGARIDITMAEQDRVAFREEWDHSAEASFAFDGNPTGRGSLRVRGKSSRRTERKSFTVELVRPQRFGPVRLKRFLLLNLLFDPGGFEMYTCFSILEELGLFVSHFQHVSLWINGDSEGLYLLVERSDDALERAVPDLQGVYRPRRAGVDIEYGVPRPNPHTLVNEFVTLAFKEQSFEAQAMDAERLMDLEQYFRWLAFNALFENGDSRHELFYYEVDGQLSLVAWDYDDVQAPPIRPAEAASDPLLYAAEMSFDFLVRDNPVLYRRYRATMARFLDELGEVELARRLRETRELLDGIDPTVERAADMAAFEERLLARHRELSRLASE